jgi:two-component sensor histidine kinase
MAALGIAWGADYTRRLASRLRTEEGLRVLAVQELGHRLKNKIVTIQAILSMRLQGYPEIQREIQGALVALARADDILTGSPETKADFASIVRAEMGPYGFDRVEIEGPNVSLPPQLALIMALLIHELATNAAKHGAFSNDRGHVAIDWTLNARRLEITWRESGGPTVTPPVTRGFGTKLFSRSLQHFGGAAQAEFAPSGLICRMSVLLE